MELEPRTAAPAHATGAVVFLPLAALDEDATFRLREEGDVSGLASSIGRLGQLEPIELRPLPRRAGRRRRASRWSRASAASPPCGCSLRDRALARVHARSTTRTRGASRSAQALLGEPLLRRAELARSCARARLATRTASRAPWAGARARSTEAVAPRAGCDAARHAASASSSCLGERARRRAGRGAPRTSAGGDEVEVARGARGRPRPAPVRAEPGPRARVRGLGRAARRGPARDVEQARWTRRLLRRSWSAR